MQWVWHWHMKTGSRPMWTISHKQLTKRTYRHSALTQYRISQSSSFIISTCRKPIVAFLFVPPPSFWWISPACYITTTNWHWLFRDCFCFHFPLLAFIALSAAQSSAQTHIHSAIVVIDTSNNAWHSQVHWLVRTPYLAIKASNVQFLHGQRYLIRWILSNGRIPKLVIVVLGVHYEPLNSN